MTMTPRAYRFKDAYTVTVRARNTNSGMVEEIRTYTTTWAVLHPHRTARYSANLIGEGR
jgi:hypothetical protein